MIDYMKLDIILIKYNLDNLIIFRNLNAINLNQIKLKRLKFKMFS